MTSLYFRAAKRCEANILRVWPAWRQAHDPDSPEFEAWKAENVAHLRDLQDQIVKGGEPDIDRGWPTGASPEQPEPEPVRGQKVVYRDSPETLAEVEALRKANAARDAEAALMANLDALEDTKEKLKERPPEPEPKPEVEIAPDVEQVLNEAGVYKSDTPEKVNEVLLRKLNEAKQCHYLALQHGGEFNHGSSVYWEQKAERYQTGLNWNRGRMAETL